MHRWWQVLCESCGDAEDGCRQASGNNWKCCFPIAVVSFGHGESKALYEMMISEEHKLLGIGKGPCSAFLQWVDKVKTKHREDLQFPPPHRGLAWAPLCEPSHPPATCLMCDPATGLPRAGKAERSPLVTAPVITGSNSFWYSGCPLPQWSSLQELFLLSICPGVDEPNITPVLGRFKPKRTQPVG